jgi:hypothetical protein
MPSLLISLSQHASGCNVSYPEPPSAFVATFGLAYLLTLCFSGICLDPITENHRVSERVAPFERVSSDTNNFWIHAHRRGAIVLLQDRVRHVREFVDGYRKSLTTMFSVMLPRNPPPENFGQLLEVFRTSRHIHRLIELNLIAGANFALG